MEEFEKDIKEIKEAIRKIEPIYPRWLDISKACKYISLSKNTLLKYIMSGDVYAKRLNGKWIVDKKSIDEFMMSDMTDIDIKKLQILR